MTIIEKKLEKDRLVKVTVKDVFENHESTAEIGPPKKLALKSGRATLAKDKVRISQPALALPIPAETSTTMATPAVTQLSLGNGQTVANSEDFGEINQEYLTSLLAAAKGGSK